MILLVTLDRKLPRAFSALGVRTHVSAPKIRTAWATESTTRLETESEEESDRDPDGVAGGGNEEYQGASGSSGEEWSGAEDV